MDEASCLMLCFVSKNKHGDEESCCLKLCQWSRYTDTLISKRQKQNQWWLRVDHDDNSASDAAEPDLLWDEVHFKNFS